MNYYLQNLRVPDSKGKLSYLLPTEPVVFLVQNSISFDSLPISTLLPYTQKPFQQLVNANLSGNQSLKIPTKGVLDLRLDSYC